MNAIITADFNGFNVSFRSDAYINATAIAKQFGKQPRDYIKTEQTQEYLLALAKHLSTKTKILVDINQLVNVQNGGNNRGTWLHPKLAIHFARWLSPEFAVWCDEQIERILGVNLGGRSTTTDERTGLRDAVNAIVSKKAMLYPDAYKLVHQRFNVQHIDELTLEQVGEATEYLHRLLLTTEKPSGYVLEEHQVKNLVNAAQSMDWIFCWFNHYKMALSGINPKMVSSVSEHFKVVWIHTQNFGRKHDMVALNHTAMRDYPWDADYESQKDWRKVVGIYK